MVNKKGFDTAKFVFFTWLFLIVLIISNVSYSQEKDTTGNNLKKNAVKGLIIGINSPNNGIAESAIYMAGYNKYLWTVGPLINVLNDATKTTYLRILAAYSLYMINDDKGMLAIRAASASDENYMLQGTCEFIYKDYLARQAMTYTTVIRE